MENTKIENQRKDDEEKVAEQIFKKAALGFA